MPSALLKTGIETAPLVVAAMALYGEAIGKTRLLQYLNSAKIKADTGKAYTAETLAPVLNQLKKSGLVSLGADGYSLRPKTRVFEPAFLQTALTTVIDAGHFTSLCSAYEKHCYVHKSWGGVYVRSEIHALAGLRFALFDAQPPEQIRLWLKAALEQRQRGLPRLHPYIEICAQPFNPALFERLHPDVQHEVMVVFLSFTIDWPDADSLAAIRNRAEKMLANGQVRPDLLAALALDWLLCGRLEDVWNLLSERSSFLTASVSLLRGEAKGAVVQFETALKAFRKDVGKRTVIVGGLSGYLYVLALLRSPDARHRKQADTYLSQVEKAPLPEWDRAVFKRLRFLQQVQSGLAKAEEAASLDTRSYETSALVQLFTSLLFYWLDSSQLNQKKEALTALHQAAEANGLHWLVAQAAELLHRMGVKKTKRQDYGQQAKALREKYGFDNLTDWFERQENWQRQLSALMSLSGGTVTLSATSASSRLIWLIAHTPGSHSIRLEPREQKRDGRNPNQWTKGRAVALRRFHEDAEAFPYLTLQDRTIVGCIRKIRSYYGSDYVWDEDKALTTLVGHPLVFWEDAPEIRVELLRGEPELRVQKQDRQLTLSLNPTVKEDSKVLIQRETPTRLRIILVTDEHRRMAAILGEGLTVPLEAEARVMEAIGAVAPLITVQSDIGGYAASIEQVKADGRLHALLLPNQQGLKMQVRVRPFGTTGAYYPPGQGSESVIAEIDGKPLQVRRDLIREAENLKRVITACPTLEKADFAHEEWQLSEPDDCLDLLLQLQGQAERVSISWPEGEKFKMAAPRLDSRQFRMRIQGERDWFAVQGELQLDENRVLDLQKLLTLVRQSPGRFIALGDNEFLALTEEFHRRLGELAAFSESSGKGGVRVHPLAAFALEDLADDAAHLKADKQWKQHLKRLKELDALQPEVPGTLQADLRDYQVDGFRWLSRLAHWGVGACLADDMGLGKTIQMLALLLARAPQGPALVVAPTSVCTNWLSEAARFAPSLNPILFGTGNRKQTISELKPLDVVVVSYGLLQQEAELFQSVTWRTLILDEAQAIKNVQTLRSDAVMALKADFRIAATGTPLENHLGELWNLFRFINPGLLGSLKQFNERFAGPIERQQDATVRQRLRRLIQPFILRRTKTQVLSELPSRTEIVLKVELTKEEAALYEALRRSALERLEEMKGAPVGQKQIQILAEMMKLRRACCNPTLVAPELGLSSSKLTAFGELLTELLENRHKALVFSQFVDHLTLIREHLDKKGITYQYLDGATPMRERKKRVDAFQTGEGDVFLISLKAGGTGLNLTAADYVIHMDPWWNPAVEDQASDRAHRMGQQRPVTIYRLVAGQTIEEAIVKLHGQKRDLADSLLEGSDVSNRMSAQEMIALLQEEFRS